MARSVFLGGLPWHRPNALQSQRPPNCFEPTDRQQPHLHCAQSTC